MASGRRSELVSNSRRGGSKGRSGMRFHAVMAPVIVLVVMAMGCAGGAALPADAPTPEPPVYAAMGMGSTRTPSAVTPTIEKIPEQPPPGDRTRDGACPSDEELAYMADMDRIAGGWSLLSADFADLNLRAASDVSLIADEDWRSEVGVILGLMEKQAEDILHMDAPATLILTHWYFSRMAIEVQAFVAVYAAGIITADQAAIIAAAGHLVEADHWSLKGTQQMEALCSEGGPGNGMESRGVNSRGA